MRQELLRLQNIQKSFPGIQALKNVNLNVFRGEVLALIGENGAGKSTLVNIISGMTPKDAGSIIFEEQEVRINSPLDARKHKISFIMQETEVVPEFTVAENIFLTRSFMHQKRNFSESKINAYASMLLKELGINLKAETSARNLTVPQKYMLGVAMAMSLDSKLLIMDETTASLATNEVDTLKRIIRNFTKKGNSVIFISHRIDEVLEIADRITILRDGMNAGTRRKQECSKEVLIKLLVGRELKEIYKRNNSVMDQELLRIQNLSTEGIIKDVSLNLKRGEILGIAGLVGSGRTELLSAVFGLQRKSAGEIYIGGEKAKIEKPVHAIRKKIAYVPEDRHSLGIINNMQIQENVSVSIIRKISRMGFINYRIQYFVAKDYKDKLKIRVKSVKQRVMNLSGGNQQKVVVARWLATQAKILLMDEPARGLDIESKRELFALMDEMANEGVGIIFTSSDMHEILGMCDRIAVMNKGKIVGEFNRHEATQEKILKLEIF